MLPVAGVLPLGNGDLLFLLIACVIEPILLCDSRDSTELALPSNARFDA